MKNGKTYLYAALAICVIRIEKESFNGVLTIDDK